MLKIVRSVSVGVLVLLMGLQPAVALVPTITPIGKIEKAQLGKYITIKGTIKEASNFSAGFKYVMADETGELAVTFFEKTYDTLPKPELVQVGAVAQITGRLDEYQGVYEIVPNKGKETLVITPTARTVISRELGGINNGDFGALVQVSGEVYSVEPFDKGVDVIVFDKSGTQKVKLWNVVAKRVAKDVLKKGTLVRVIGKVRTSRALGLRIEPALPVDVIVVKQPSAVSAQP
jgi:DNA/RNA endonuclease YhcR with UshA esterase domain